MLAALSALAYAGILAYAAARVPSFAGLVLGIGALGALLLLFVLWLRTDELLPWAVVVLGIAYTTSLLVHGGGTIDGAAPLVAVGLLVCAELAAWSLDESLPVRAERAVVLGRLRALTALSVAGLVASGLVVGLSAAPGARGLAWTVFGAASAVGVVAVASRLLQRAG